MRVSVALGSTARAACRACLRRSVAFGMSANRRSSPSSNSVYARTLASVASTNRLCSSGSSAMASGSTIAALRSGTYRWDSCEYEKCRWRISSWVNERETPVKYIVTVPCSSTDRWPTSRMWARYPALVAVAGLGLLHDW